MRESVRYVAPPVPRSNWWLLGVLSSTAAMISYALAELRGDHTARGLIIAPIVLLLAAPLISRLRRADSDFDKAGIVFAALGVKLLAIHARYWMVNSLYDGVGDSSTYDAYGKYFAPSFRRFDFSVEVGAKIPGTGFLRILTGVVYALFGSDLFTGYLVFGMLGFIGCWFFYRAFEAAVPEGNHKRYLLLVLFWPSLMFWPSSIGKESWMLFSLGLASWGAATVYRHLAHGFPILALGITCAAMPRPHIAIVVLAAAGVGLATATFFGAGAGGRTTGIATKIIGILFLLGAGAILAPLVADFLNIDDVGGTGLTDSLDYVNKQTSQGGSAFDAPEVHTPLDYPWAAVTVLLRPFPYEVTSAATAISALEGLLLLGLFARSLNELRRLPSQLIRNAYVAYTAAFTFMFIYVFASIGNFGILARQRTQMFPFVLVLVALPTLTPRKPQHSHARSADDERSRDAGPKQRVGRPVPTLAPPRARTASATTRPHHG